MLVEDPGAIGDTGESSVFIEFWTPASAGVMGVETFYKIVNFNKIIFSVFSKFRGFVIKKSCLVPVCPG